MEQNQKPQPIQVTLPVTVAVLLASFSLQAERDRSESHTVEYYVTDAVVDYITAKRRSWKTSKAAKSAKNFADEIAADPTIINDASRLTKLQQKFGIGGTQVNMGADRLASKLTRAQNLE